MTERSGKVAAHGHSIERSRAASREQRCSEGRCRGTTCGGWWRTSRRFWRQMARRSRTGRQQRAAGDIAKISAPQAIRGMADLRRLVRRPPPQRTAPDLARHRRAIAGRVATPTAGRTGSPRNIAHRSRQHDDHFRASEPGVGARCHFGSRDLDFSARASAGAETVLRSCQSRSGLARRARLRRNAGCPFDRPGRQHRQDGLGRCGRGLLGGLQHHGRTARDRRSGGDRRCGRGIQHARLHRRLRRSDRQEALALLHGALCG